MLQALPLTYSYPDSPAPALQQVSFSLAQGEGILLLGGNGSGKSTLCYTLAGFIPHFFQGTLEGDVLLAGHSMRATSLGNWVQQVGLVLQDPFNQLSGARYTVFEEVAFGLENLGVPRPEIGARVGDILEQLGISALAERSPLALSGGQMQRVALASILVLRPQLLVLDEPAAQLDPQGRRELLHLLEGLAGEGTTLVLATHDTHAAPSLTQRAAILERGHLRLLDTTPAVLSDPRLPAWRVQPPPMVHLAITLGLPLPYPLTVAEAAVALARAPKPLLPAPPPPEGAGGPLLPAVPPIQPIRVRLDEVHAGYAGKIEALQGLSLVLEPGRLTALIGANGAGKSTVARTLNGLLRPTAGRLSIGEWDVTRWPTHQLARRVAYLFQNPDEQLFKRTVEEEVAFAPISLGMAPFQVSQRVAWALAMTGLLPYTNYHPHELLPALRRWVALASVLAQGASVLLLDEPDSGQDLAGRQRLIALLAALKRAGYTLLLISHDMSFVAEQADQVIVLADGCSVAQGSPAEVFSQEATLRAAQLELPPLVQLSRMLGLDDPLLTPDHIRQALA